VKVGDLNRWLDKDGWRSAKHPRWCPGCGESRLVTATTIAGRTAFHCDVCTQRWVAADDDVLDISGHLIGGDY